MIVDLPSTTTAEVAKKMVALRDNVGSMALSRVLTLVVITNEDHADGAIETANDATRQHPSRIIVVVTANRRGASRLDAQIRVGGDAGASEVVVLRLFGPLADHGRSVVTPLLLADSPIVAWWPSAAPKNAAADPIGAMAQRRVTDSARATAGPKITLARLAATYADGDTDLAWSRITLWRGLLAAALDQAPYDEVTSATVIAAPDSPSGDLLAGWLADSLACPVALARATNRSGIISVRLTRASGNIDLVRPQDGNVATLCQAGQPDRSISLPHRNDAECLADELRRLDTDEVYAAALRHGLGKVASRRSTHSAVVRAGLAPSEADAIKVVTRLRRQARLGRPASMVVAPLTPPAPMPEDAAPAKARAKPKATPRHSPKDAAPAKGRAKPKATPRDFPEYAAPAKARAKPRPAEQAPTPTKAPARSTAQPRKPRSRSADPRS